MGNGGFEVTSGSLLVANSEVRGAVDGWAGEEGSEDGGASAAERGVGDVGVLATDGDFVGVEGGRRSAKNGEVRIDDEADVWIGGGVVVAGGEDEVGDAIDVFGGQAELGQGGGGEVGGTLLVVVTAGIVDCVVEPEGGLNRVQLDREVRGGVQLTEAVRDVGEGVVVAMGFLMAPDEVVKDGLRIAGGRPNVARERASAGSMQRTARARLEEEASVWCEG